MPKVSITKKRVQEIQKITKKTLSSRVLGIIKSIDLPTVSSLCQPYCCDFCSCDGTPCRDCPSIWDSNLDTCFVVFPTNVIEEQIQEMEPERFKTVKESLIALNKTLQQEMLQQKKKSK